MKPKITLLFLLIAFIANAQYDYYNNQTQLGVGIGSNLVSVVGDDVKPTEISMRFRINRKHILQLYMPYLKQNDTFKSKGDPEMGLIKTSLNTKKRLYGIGLDYDYALHSFSSLDFVVGLRAELQLYQYRTRLTNTKFSSGSNYSDIEFTYHNKETRNHIVSPSAGLRLNLNRFSIDAKVLLSMLSTKGDVDGSIEINKGMPKDWTDHISKKFKLKPGISISTSYFF